MIMKLWSGTRGMLLSLLVLALASTFIALTAEGQNQTQDNRTYAETSDNKSEYVDFVVLIHDLNAEKARNIRLFIDGISSGKDPGQNENVAFPNDRPTYRALAGNHIFKIIWENSVTGEDCSQLTTKMIERTGSPQFEVHLYIIRNATFDIDVSVKNEYDNEIDSSLYLDGKFKNIQTLKKNTDIGNWTEFPPIELEEGIHQVSIRWQDPATNMEYEKKKMITVDGKKSVFFIINKGIRTSEKPPQDKIEQMRENAAVKNASSEIKPAEEITPSSTPKSGISAAKKSTSVEQRNKIFLIFILMLLVAIYFAIRH